MRNKMFFFDHEGFLQEAQPYIQKADIGDYEAILNRAQSIANDISSQQWILEGLGTSLTELNTPEKSWQVGSAFLVLLSKYLQPYPAPIRRINWIWTAVVVSHFGWSKQDVDLLSKGMATTYLMKPELVPDPLLRPPANDKRWREPSYYWWCVRPANAYYTGWLAYPQFVDFYGKLELIREEYLQLDVSMFDLPSNITITSEDMVKDYEETIRLFQTAIDAKAGLFFVLV